MEREKIKTLRFHIKNVLINESLGADAVVYEISPSGGEIRELSVSVSAGELDSALLANGVTAEQKNLLIKSLYDVVMLKV